MTSRGAWQPRIVGSIQKQDGRPGSPFQMSIPDCDPADTIIQGDLDKAQAQNQVRRIKYVYTAEGGYLMFTLASNLDKEFYLATRRERTRPKIFVDQNALLANLYANFPGLVFEANANWAPSPPTPAATSPAEAAEDDQA